MSIAEMSALSDSEYERYATVIDITMGEFAISTFYPIHSASYATCMGVVVGAVTGYGACLAHLDPMAPLMGRQDEKEFYVRSLERMITRLQAEAKTIEIDLLFFKDGHGALGKHGLADYLQHEYSVRTLIDRTDAKGTKYDEAVVMPSAFSSAYVFLKPHGDHTNVLRGKRVILKANGKSGLLGNGVAERIGRAREIKFVSDSVVETEDISVPSKGLLDWW